MYQVDLTEARNLADAQAMIVKFAKDNPNAKWIVGRGWQYTIFPGGLPKRQDIDAVISDRPVYLRAYDGHTAWANSKALEIAGVTKDSKFEGFGEIVRDADGIPTGVFKEGASSHVSRLLPPVTRDQQLKALELGLRYAASLGITSIQNAHGSLAEVELYFELLKKEKLTLKTKFAFSIGPETTQAEIDQIAILSRQYDSPMLRIGAVKIMADGVIESHTAAMLAPYSNKPETSGTPNFTPEQLNRVVAMAGRANLQVYIHAIGDRGVRMALDAFENAIEVNGRRDSRFRIEHIETIDPADIPRFKALGVIASMEPIHADPGTIDIWAAAIGPERTSRGFAWRALERAGATLIFSSDMPAAITMSPWRGLHNAVNRQTIELLPVGGWLPEHRVPVETALTAYTKNGAYASFEQEMKGQIRKGQLADLVVLDRDPFAIKSRDLFKIQVLETFFDGKPIFGPPFPAR
jgi:predicted amidohydrolase YtcJ